jgi:hypothetical protein
VACINYTKVRGFLVISLCYTLTIFTSSMSSHPFPFFTVFIGFIITFLYIDTMGFNHLGQEAPKGDN